MNYYKIVNVFSKINLILGTGFLILLFYSFKNGSIAENPSVRFALKSFSLYDEPSFASAALQIVIGTLGINIKKGTGAPGGCVVFGLIFAMIKFFDIMIFITSENTPGLQLSAAISYFVLYIVFIYCCSKQWDKW